MNKLSIYEHSIKDIKAAFYDIITFEETQGNEEKVSIIKNKMTELIILLNQEVEQQNSNNEQSIKEEINLVNDEINTIDFSKIEQNNNEENGLVEEQKEASLKLIDEENIEKDDKKLTMIKINNKKARAILVLEKQITKLKNSREVKKQELENLIKENEEFMKSVSIPADGIDTEQKVKELEEQIKKYYSENNFEMAEKLLNQIKELSN